MSHRRSPELERLLQQVSKLPKSAVMRGESKKYDSPCLPSLYREKPCPVEEALLRSFWIIMRNRFIAQPLWPAKEPESFADALRFVAPFAQHFGVPTRLLDWTRDVKFALLIVALDHAEEDGAVYWFDLDRLYALNHNRWDSLHVPLGNDSAERDFWPSLFQVDPRFVTHVNYPRLPRLAAQDGLMTVGTQNVRSHWDDLERFGGVIGVPAGLKPEIIAALARSGLDAAHYLLPAPTTSKDSFLHGRLR